MALFDTIRMGSSGGSDYEIERSLRFNNTDQTEVTNSSLGTSPTSRKIQTISVWFKRGDFDADGMMTHGFSGSGGSASGAALRFVSGGDNLSIENQVNNSQAWQLVTTRLFRDSAAWYHLVVAIDTTQGTSSNRVKIYVNGVQETSFSTANYPSQNYDNLWLYSNVRLGSWDGNGYYAGYNGYLAEYNAIDGQQLAPSDFGKTDATTGQWKPIKYTGSYGTNGHYLNFSDNSGTTATTLGKDYSGNGKNFTPSNLSVSAGDGNDSKTDTPTLNKATLNPLTGFTYNATLSEGNLKMSGSSGFKEISTIAFAGTSKFYYEVVNTSRNGWQLVGIFVGQPNNPSNALTNTAVWGFASTQATYFGGSYTSTSDVPDWTNNDVMGIKYENGSLKLYKNGTLATATTSSVPTGDIVFAYIANDNQNAAAFARFSSNDWTQDSAAGVDATWELSSANLPDPTIKLPNKHFDTLLYTGNGTSGHAITGLDFQPDFVWIKNRDGTYYHNLSDTVRGITKAMNSNSTDTENTYSNIQSVQSNGFTVGGSELVNKNNQDLVAWNWNAGGSTVTNTDGSLSAQVRANPTAGFSILTYTGTNNVSETLGHGLGVKPDMIIVKSRDVSGQDWVVYNKNLDGGNQPATHILKLNGYAGEQDVNDVWQDTEPTSSVFTVGTEAMVNYTTGNLYVAYCFAGVEGYSKFGKYVGNGSSDGTYVYTGFKPAFVITRGLHGTSWYIYDNKRNPVNVVNKELNSNNTQSEATFTTMDFNSNGFKIRSSNDAFNYNNYNYIYIAFAESPFKYSRAR